MSQSTKEQCLYRTPDTTIEQTLKEPSTSGFVKASDLVSKSNPAILKGTHTIDSETVSTSIVTAPVFVSVSKLVPSPCAQSQVNGVNTECSSADNGEDIHKRKSRCASNKSSSLVPSPAKTSPTKSPSRKNLKLERAASSSSKITAFFSEWVKNLFVSYMFLYCTYVHV